jgi:hypothetical protein
MRRVFSLSLLAGLCVAGLAGCAATNKTEIPIDYQSEGFSSTNTFAHTFAGTGAATCEAARRALLSQGYLISEAKEANVRGRKNFQPSSDVHVQIEFNVVCAPDSKGSNSTTAFANAVRDRYSLKKSSNSASVGVGVLGSLSLPIGATDDSLVKVASETIPSGKFYRRFFELVESYLDASSPRLPGGLGSARAVSPDNDADADADEDQ